MHIFLTGGTGFVGSQFLRLALEENHIIKAAKRFRKSSPKIPLRFNPHWITKSLSDINIKDFNDSDTLVHLATHSANVPYDNLENCLKINVFDTLSLFNSAYDAGIRKFIVTGSSHEYGKKAEEYEFIPPDAALFPTQSYPTSKAAASIVLTQWALNKNVSLKILRLFQVYGEGELESRLWPSIIRKAKNGENLKMTLGEQIRDFIDVKDVAKIILNESLKLESNKISIKNIGSGNPKKIRDFALEIWRTCNAKGKIEFGAIPYRENEIMRYVPDIQKEYFLR